MRYKELIDSIKNDKENRIFYHITERSNLESILTNGLIPQRGPRRSKSFDGPSDLIFLTHKDHVNNWMKSLTNEIHKNRIINPVIIKADCRSLNLIWRSYYIEGVEIGCKDIITPERLEVVIL